MTLLYYSLEGFFVFEIFCEGSFTVSYSFHPTLLREYDIRGIIGETFDSEDARMVGRGLGTLVRRGGGERVCVGYDGRLTSPELEGCLVEGLVSTGLVVERVGRGPTPMVYFALYERGADAGVIVTGSHNPAEYNGIKMTYADGPLYGEQIQRMGRLVFVGDFEVGRGSVLDVDVREEYIERLCLDYGASVGLTVAWDAGNGVVSDVLAPLTERIRGRHYRIFDTVDGTFPNHHPDPTIKENLLDLQRVVEEYGCDVGIGFDGDGDRIGVLDDRGRMLYGDQLLVLYASEVLRTHRGATIIGDVKSSQMLFDEVVRLGGIPLMWKTGHSLLRAKMKEVGAILAGEMSGHIFFGDKWYGFDDGLYCAVRLLNLLALGGRSLSVLYDEFPVMINTPELRLSVEEDRKLEIVEEVKGYVVGSGAEVVDIDGVRVRTSEGWWLLRASNTQNMLVVRIEAQSEDGLMRLKETVRGYLEKSGVVHESLECVF